MGLMGHTPLYCILALPRAVPSDGIREPTGEKVHDVPKAGLHRVRRAARYLREEVHGGEGQGVGAAGLQEAQDGRHDVGRPLRGGPGCLSSDRAVWGARGRGVEARLGRGDIGGDDV